MDHGTGEPPVVALPLLGRVIVDAPPTLRLILGLAAPVVVPPGAALAPSAASSAASGAGLPRMAVELPFGVPGLSVTGLPAAVGTALPAAELPGALVSTALPALSMSMLFGLVSLAATPLSPASVLLVTALKSSTLLTELQVPLRATAVLPVTAPLLLGTAGLGALGTGLPRMAVELPFGVPGLSVTGLPAAVGTTLLAAELPWLSFATRPARLPAALLAVLRLPSLVALLSLLLAALLLLVGFHPGDDVPDLLRDTTLLVVLLTALLSMALLLVAMLLAVL